MSIIPTRIIWALAPALLLGLSGAGCSIEIIKSPGDCGMPPDQRPPDLRIDGAPPDHAAPDVGKWSTLVDDSFADFHAGQLSEGGARIYVSSRGNVQLTQTHDLNRDGRLDLLLSNQYNGSSYKLNSYLYRGSSSGYGPNNRVLLPTLGAQASSSSDLNADGFVDLLVSNGLSDAATASVIYWGSASGLSAVNNSPIPSRAARGNAVADLDDDGYLDLVLANSADPQGTFKINSYIYWGSAVGYSAGKRLGLPTVGAHDVAIADLDGDGDLDLVFANYRADVGNYEINSHVYWGSPSGYSDKARTALPTVGAMACSAADLNRDGWIDLLFANHNNGKNFQLDSYIYWGSKNGFTAANRNSLASLGARHSAVADLDGDGYLDVVLSNYYDGKNYNINSYVYWGSSTGFSTARRASLPTIGAASAALADLNGDGYRDILFANRYDGTSYQQQSYIYWGAKGGFSTANRSQLPGMGASALSIRDPGAVSDRKAVQSFRSRIFDTKAAAPVYGWVSWSASAPAGTSIKLQLRSAASPTALQNSAWYGPTSATDYYISSAKLHKHPINATHKGDRYLQYRALLSSDFTRTPVLDRVVIEFR